MKASNLFLAIALCAAIGCVGSGGAGGPPEAARSESSPHLPGDTGCQPVATVIPFDLSDARAIYPAYRTWDFEISEAGLYVFEIVPPDAKTRPAVREWLDGVQIAFARAGADYADKAGDNGTLRRFRWLEPGTHTFDLFLNLGTYPWRDDMERAMVEKGVRALCRRAGGLMGEPPSPAAVSRSGSPCPQGIAGFWQEGSDPDCLARMAGEPLVVAACCAGGASSPSEPPRTFTMEVREARIDKSVVSAAPSADIPLWSQTLAVSNTPVRFSYPCDREGAYRYLVRDAATGEVVEGPWDFSVTSIECNRMLSNAVGAESDQVQSDAIEIDRVDCTESAGGPHLFREGGKSVIVETPDGPYRLSGPQGFKFVWRRQDAGGRWVPAEEGEKGAQRKSFHDWFAYTLKVEHPGKAHALVVRVPNDRRHFTSVVAYDRRTRLSNAWSIDSGDAPVAGPWSEMKIPLWPNSDAIDVMVLSTDGAHNTHVPHPDRRGAVASLALLEYPGGFPALEAPACGWNATREFGWDGEQINLGPHERTMPPLPDAAAALVWDPVKGAALWSKGPYNEWSDFRITWERTFELEAWRGGTILMFPVYSYDMVTFQGRSQMIVPPGKDVYAEGCFGGGERNPFDRDVFALMLQMARKHGVKLVADFMVQRTYPPVVAAWARLCGMEGATNGFYLTATADGQPYRPAHCVYAGMLNPAHPVARRIQIEFCREFGRRYGRYESFAGFNHRFWKGWPPSFEPWFYDDKTGFDDFTVGEFSKATGLQFEPVGNDDAAFEARRKRIGAEYAREWKAWRAEVCRSLHEEMLAALREGAPQARFYSGAWRDALSDASGLAPSVFSGKREFGFGDERAKIRGPGVEINNLDPIHFGNFWVHSPQGGASTPGSGALTSDGGAVRRPPPTGLCCNSSYRCSPYHLEPAALALAENKLDHLWAGGQWCLPPLDDALRAFVRAYRAIPDRADWVPAEDGRSESFAPVALWWAQDGGDVLFWAVNRTDAERKVVLRFEKEPASLEDCVGGGKIAFASGRFGVPEKVSTTQKLQDSKTPSSESNNLCEIALSPFMPGVFRAKSAGDLLGYEVPVEEAEAAQIEKDFAFIAAMGAAASGGVGGSPAAARSESSPHLPQAGGFPAAPVEVRPLCGRTYYDPAGALGKLDERWTFADLFAPMAAARDAGDLHTLRALLADFKTNHRWWYEAFGWPDDFCIERTVGRMPLAAFLRQAKRTEMWFGETNGVSTAAFPQTKDDSVCAPQGVPLDILRHGPPGGFRQLELTALFGGGYGDIRVEDSSGEVLGIIGCNRGQSIAPEAAGEPPAPRQPTVPRLETRILSVPIVNPGHQTHVRLVGTGEKGLAILRLDFVTMPSRPISEWLVIGPFDKGGGEKDRGSYSKTFPPETEPFDPDAAYTGLGGETVRWQAATLGPGERILDVAAATPCEVSRCNAVTYLRATVRAPRKMPTILRYANDYYGTIWLNGKPIVPEMRGPIGEYKGVEVWLEAGENTILVKTSPGSAGTWYFGMSVEDCGELGEPGPVPASRHLANPPSSARLRGVSGAGTILGMEGPSFSTSQHGLSRKAW